MNTKRSQRPKSGEHAQHAAYLRAETFSDGAHIYEPGDPADRLFLLKSGRVRLYGSSKGEVLTEIVSPEEVFGQIPRRVSATYGETAIADGECEVWTLRGEELARFHSERPGPAESLLESLARRTHRLAQRVHAAAYKEVPARIADVLLELAERFGEPCAHGEGEFDLKGVTQQDLADMVGSSRPYASTFCNELKRAGEAELIGRVICVRNQSALRRRAAAERIRT